MSFHVLIFFFFFFFKQKTAYEIYQCDWSSDVCSSDLTDVEDVKTQRGVDLRDTMEYLIVVRDNVTVYKKEIGRA